jgi:hypothetical protein
MKIRILALVLMTATTTLLAAPTLWINPVGSSTANSGAFSWELKNPGKTKVFLDRDTAIVELNIGGKMIPSGDVAWKINAGNISGSVAVSNPPHPIPPGMYKVKAKFRLTDGTIVPAETIVNFQKK